MGEGGAMPDPSAWPVEVRRYIAKLTLDRALEQHDGWEGLVQSLYAGKLRGEERLPFAPSVAFLWPMVLEDAAAWSAQNKGGK